MIPKVIHYCWFGKTPKSPLIQKCLQSWKKKMPDYEIKEWNESTFDVDSIPFTRTAYAEKKWAFVADYVRLYALYHEGGIYLDTDIKILKKLDPFLDYSFFSCQESHPDIFVPESITEDYTRNKKFNQVLGIGLCSAVMGSVPRSNFVGDCLKYYQNLTFSREGMKDIIIVNILPVILEKYGYRYILDKKQTLQDNMVILEPYYFAGISTFTEQSYALHLYNGSWGDDKDLLKYKIRNKFPTIYTWFQNIIFTLKGIPRIPFE